MHDFHAPVRRSGNENALSQKGYGKRSVCCHKGTVSRRRGVVGKKCSQAGRHAFLLGQRLGQKQETKSCKNCADEGQNIEVTFPGKVGGDDAADYRSQRRAKTEDHGYVGHQHLCFRPAEKVTNDGHSDHHAAAGKNALTQTPENKHRERIGSSSAET